MTFISVIIPVLDKEQISQDGVLENLVGYAFCDYAEVRFKQLLDTTQHGKPNQEIVLIPLDSYFQIIQAHIASKPLIICIKHIILIDSFNLVSAKILFGVKVACFDLPRANIQVVAFENTVLQLQVVSVIDVRLDELSVVLGISVRGFVQESDSILCLRKEFIGFLVCRTCFFLEAISFGLSIS